MTIAQILRHKAAGLQKKVDHCFRERLTNTRRRAQEDQQMRNEGHTLHAVQAVMRKMADLHDSGACPAAIKGWRDTTKIETAVRVVRTAERQQVEHHDGSCLLRLTEEQKAIRAIAEPCDDFAGHPAAIASPSYHARRLDRLPPKDEPPAEATEKAASVECRSGRPTTEPVARPEAPPPIAGAADPEYQTRIDAERVTAELKTKSRRKLDSGRKPITDSPLFGGPSQLSLF